MFKRVTFEDWQTIITLIAFVLTFATFIFFTVRALLMKKRDLDHTANLPLEDQDGERVDRS
ncbi:MAG: hypothetical protein Q7P63_11685 [Verrucomicrobiota bacterium JB022]|nr:hypothetical protein [Verrucomicrobiota bacterium JB022]